MIKGFLNSLRANYVTYRGTSLKQKFVVIESDDWGSIRMPSRESYELLLKKGAPVDSSFFTRYDCLETNEDVDRTLDLLMKFKDSAGRHPCITANVVTANPDFAAIRDSGMKEYSYQNFEDTYQEYSGSAQVMKTWKASLPLKLIWPQYHGREHLNVREWMLAIRGEDPVEKLAFDQRVLLGLPNSNVSRRSNSYMSALEFDTQDEIQELEGILGDGLRLFRNAFGFEPASFMPPCGIMSDKLTPYLSDHGIRYLQSGRYFTPKGQGVLEKRDRFIGDQNESGQLFWRRNCTFEPSKDLNKSYVEDALSQINLAFRWGKPAILNTHRVNFSGAIDVRNRDNTLGQLGQLLKKIQKQWPDVRFCSSDELGDYIRSSKA